ncbi:hypothetical protein [Thermomonas flagellata]|uniref:hypothetical protein n=1 Tax=Thermomonas flagellata TaxID=2888524 RepID=UPI001F034A60|nr:hypothetical protein [Thermomonas flagellata]
MPRAALPALCLLLAACGRAPAPPPAAPAAAPTAAASDASATRLTPPAPDAETAWRLPGRFGPLTPQSELEARYGKANLREELTDGAEGIGRRRALVLYPDDPARRLELVLDADNPDAPIQELRVATPGARWHDAGGVRVGLPLRALVALNGAPVSFYGLGWDYGGTVQDWHGGRLANAEGGPLFRRVVLGPRPGLPPRALPQGDGLFRSDDPRWPGLDEALVVVEFAISWPEEGH